MKAPTRHGVLIRPTGRFEIVNLGMNGSRPIEEDISMYFDGDEVEAARTSDELLFYSRTERRESVQNPAASYYANTPIFGDCIMIEKHSDGYEYKAAFETVTLYKYDWEDHEHGRKRTYKKNAG